MKAHGHVQEKSHEDRGELVASLVAHGQTSGWGSAISVSAGMVVSESAPAAGSVVAAGRWRAVAVFDVGGWWDAELVALERAGPVAQRGWAVVWRDDLGDGAAADAAKCVEQTAPAFLGIEVDHETLAVGRVQVVGQKIGVKLAVSWE